MFAQETSADQFSRLFRHYYEALSEDFRCGAGAFSGTNSTPEGERDRLFTAVRLALTEVASTSAARSFEEKDDDRRRFFAKPGEAEWGC